MKDHYSNTVDKPKTFSLRLKIFTFTGVLAAILLVADTFFYFRLQSHMSHQVALMQAQARSLRGHAEFNITRRGGWPIGAWARIDTPKFNQTNDSNSVSFLGTATRIGGTWPEWIKAFIHYHAMPITLVGKSVVALSNDTGTATILMENGHFYHSGNSSPDKNIKTPFYFQQIRVDVKELDGTLGTIIFHDVKGVVNHNGNATSQHAKLALESSSQHVESLFHYGNTPIPLEMSHVHLALNALRDGYNTNFTLQDYSFQLPSLALSYPPQGSTQTKKKENSHPVPALALSGKYSTDTKSGDVTLRVDAWRDLIKATYHHFGKAITGNEASPYGEALLDKLFRTDDHNYDKPLIMSASIRNAHIESLDMGVLQPLFNTLAELRNSGSLSP